MDWAKLNLLISLGSPFRGFTVINSTESGLKIVKKVRPDELLVGSGLLYVGVGDYVRWLVGSCQ